MTITIQKVSNIKVTGTHSNGNSKPVFCITTGEVYASQYDAAEANNMHPSTLSNLISNNGTSRSGKRFCFVANIVEYIDEIAECSRIRTMKVKAYDEAEAKKEAARKAEEEYKKRKANCEMLQQKLAKEMMLLSEAEKNLNNNKKAM